MLLTVFSNRIEKKLVNLSGTIPVTFKGNFNIYIFGLKIFCTYNFVLRYNLPHSNLYLANGYTSK